MTIGRLATRSRQPPSTSTRPIAPRRSCEPGPASRWPMLMPTPTSCTSRGACRDDPRNGCWAHLRRKRAPIVVEAVTRFDAIFAVERAINGITPFARQAVREQTIRPLVDVLARLNGQRRTLSPKSDTSKAKDYGLKRLPAFSRLIHDGRIGLSQNAAVWAMRCVAMGCNDRTLAGNNSGGRRAAAIYTLTATCKLNNVDPRAWLADALGDRLTIRQAYPQASAFEQVARARDRLRHLSNPVLASSGTHEAPLRKAFAPSPSGAVANRYRSTFCKIAAGPKPI